MNQRAILSIKHFSHSSHLSKTKSFNFKLETILAMINSQAIVEPTAIITDKGDSNGGATQSHVKFSQEEKQYHRHITLGIEEKLQKNRMIKDIKLVIRKPAEKSNISSWERKHRVSLPSDLKDFYLSTNGFKLTWSLEHAGDNLRIGDMNINEINQLLPLESLDNFGILENSGDGSVSINKTSQELKTVKSKLSSELVKLQLSNRNNSKQTDSIPFSELRKTMNKAIEVGGQRRTVPDDVSKVNLLSNDKGFILDQNKYGWVCIIYPEALNNFTANLPNSPRSKEELSQEANLTVEVWFLDNSFQWNYLAPSFSHYYRMLLFHLGLPQWQYRFTSYGLSSWAEQMFWLVSPHLLTSLKITSIDTSRNLWSSDVPPEAATPNLTPNVLSNNMFRRKKKQNENTN